jgi:UDPglucose 6-dehydrogenase
MKVTIFGAGYVGLVTGACFAEMGNDVLCVDVDEERIRGLNAGECPIFEPGLEPLIAANVAGGRLAFTTDARRGVDYADVMMIAVGTPPGEDGAADLTHVLAVAETIATYMRAPKVIVEKSTVPVGTADKIANRVSQVLASRGENLPFSVVANPEFLKEGGAVNDFMRPDRIIIGSADRASTETLKTLYAPFNRNHDKVLVMDTRSAELTKDAANAILATKISLMNELSNVAERVGADIEEVRKGIGSDPRIGYHFIYSGCGFGGSCFPKDLGALYHTAREVGFEAALVGAVQSVNARQKRVLFEKIQRHFSGALKDRVFAIWGLAFKPNTDDMREAPSVDLIEALTGCGAKVRAYDPAAGTDAMARFDGGAFAHADNRYDALDGADALVICTEWNEFRSPDFDTVKERLAEPVIFDGRNLYDAELLATRGFKYYGIGRGVSLYGEGATG